MKLTAMVAVLAVCASYISYGQGAKYLLEMEETSLGPGKDYDIGIKKSVNHAPLMPGKDYDIVKWCKFCGLGVRGKNCCIHPK